ncbi:angiopoietin-related protein 7-like [Argopecten irradians]|uniref:angiopoietin-related protein 7-like n=1 Tax=Argopecten irradians TaxID=31199 RepID=UPI00371E424D
MYDEYKFNSHNKTLPVQQDTAVFRDCSFIPDGYSSGVYHIKPTDDTIVAYCDMDRTDGPWTVIQRRINGDVDFYRNWTEYKNGFGDLLGNFWIGNDKLHQLTATPRVLRVELGAWNGTTGFAKYSRFQVASEDLNYKILVEEFSGHIGKLHLLSYKSSFWDMVRITAGAKACYQ